jgi:adenylate cyclase
VLRLVRNLRRSAVYVLPLAVLMAAVLARVGARDLLDRLSLICFDEYQRLAPRPLADLPIRIVDIDDASLHKIGQWPWPRTRIAELIDRLREDGARLIAFDIVFAEHDRSAPQARSAAAAAAPPGADPADPDRILQEAIKRTVATVPVVTGFILTDRSDAPPPAIQAGFALAGTDPLVQVKNYKDAIPNLPFLERAASGNGFLNQSVDWDHVVRRVPLILKRDGQPVPSLVAEVLRVATGARTYIARGAGASGQYSFGENTGLNALRIGPLTIPTDAAGRVALHFSTPQRDLYVSAADILDGKADPSLIRDDIVLVGTSAEGVINDLQATPLSPNMPGVEIHTQLIGQILQGNFLVRPDWALGGEIMFTVLMSIALVVVLPTVGALLGALFGGIVVAAAVEISWFAFSYAQMLLDPVYPIAVLTIVYLMARLVGYWRTEAGQRQIRNAFARYMSPVYVEELARHPEKLVLGGESRELTIMFCDIRGFTSLAEGLDARALTQLMNSFTSPMTDIITAHKGTIDKYIGDCIMAFWNAPLDDPEHARNAVRAAQEMRRRLVELNRGWEREAAASGAPFRPLRVGIGVNTGECVVGNFGSSSRFNYSLLGDPVNLASRLESLSKLYGVDLVIGEETAMRLGDPALIELDLVAVKGKQRAVHVYTLPPPGSDKERFVAAIARQAALLTAYRRQDWNVALQLLDDEHSESAGGLTPVYDLYRRRITHFQSEPPPSDWDGVYTAEEK